MNRNRANASREPRAFLRTRFLYALALCVIAYYVTKLPLFVAGWYRNQMIPGFEIVTQNPLGVLYCLLWAKLGFRLKWLFGVLFVAVGLVISCILSLAYFQSQPPDLAFSIKFVTFYFFASSATIMPLLTAIGCEQSNKFGPMIFRDWE
jgi:uncharacterized membrane protein YciS (DUF1049 family)